MPFEPEDEGADLTFSGEAQGQPQKIILKVSSFISEKKKKN